MQSGDQGEFFKNRPKSSPRLKGPKALWRKWHYPLISMQLKDKDWRRFWHKQWLQKCPNGQVMAIIARSPKTRIFFILLLVCTYTAKTGDDFGEKGGSKSARIAKLWKVSQNHPKPAFSEKVQREDQKKFSPGLKGPKAHWLKWHYPIISIHLKCKDWTRFWRKQRLPKCPNGQVMAIFARSPKTRIFWKSAKGGPREIF